MAGTGTVAQIVGVLDTWGGRTSNTVDYTGVKAYVVGGEVIDPKSMGFFNSIYFLQGSVSVSGTYEVIPKPVGKGVTAWKTLWYVVSTGAEVAVNTDLSAESVKLWGYGV